MNSVGTVADHYRSLLAPIYSWMVGDFDAASAANIEYFDSVGLKPAKTQVAVDLGCGHGVQSVALARTGFDVVAIDNSVTLLDELNQNSKGLSINTVNDDLMNVSQHVKKADAIVCMGDTLTHLESEDSVKQLLLTSSNIIEPQGKLVLSFRDYSSSELTGIDRIIPVRSDDNRIHTCFLEYLPTTVIVHDLVYTRSAADQWELNKSAYPKLRLAPQSVIEYSISIGLNLVDNTIQQGMNKLVFEKLSA